VKQRHLTLGELIQRSADRIYDMEKFLRVDRVAQSFLSRESSILLKLAMKFWWKVRWIKIQGKLFLKKSDASNKSK